ncbi:MAG TPA: PhoU domain-containing protein [Candidatus Bathyarchaeia archaeon]|nr:PhoU domain-containing protein [Candidatus Bathyarchaeia archaeon]
MLQSKLTEETRKLQFTGGSTYTLSLPKRWITQNQLKRGSVIKLREEEGGLLSIIPADTIIQEQRLDEATIRVTLKDSPDTVVRKAVSAYLVGYNMIHVRAENQKQLSGKQRHEIKDFSRRMLVGTEIVTDTPQELTLQVLLSYPELSVQSALRRMSIITASMHRDAMTALKGLDHQQAKEVTTSDNEVDRFNLYIVRQLKTAIQNPRIIKEIGLQNARDCLGYRLVTKSVERTADHAANIAENVLSLKKRLEPEAIEKLEKMSAIAISMFETAIEALFRKDYSLAESIVEKTKEVILIEKEALVSSQKMDIEEAPYLRLIIESIRRTAEYASDIAEIVLNLTVESILT